mgnify:CR=1 FL=1
MDAQYLTHMLLRCIVVGFGLLLIWFILVLVGGNVLFEIHSKIFNITRHEFDLVHYWYASAGAFLLTIGIITAAMAKAIPRAISATFSRTCWPGVKNECG